MGAPPAVGTAPGPPTPPPAQGRTAAPAPPPPPASSPPPADAGDALLTAALLAVMAAAVLPFGQVFTTGGWIRPLAGAVLLSCGVGVVARRLRVGPVVGLGLSLLGLGIFLTVAFTPREALFSLLPTPSSLAELWELFQLGLELVETRQSPTFPDPALLLLAVSGAWVMVYLADGLLFVMRSPIGTILAAVVLWVIPLTVADEPASILVPGATMLAAAGIVLLVGNVLTQTTFGAHVGGPRGVLPVPPSGWVVLAAVVALGVAAAPLLPGFDDDAVFRVSTRAGGGTTITTNPIVNIQDRLVAGDTGPVLFVRTPRPVYLRTTSLDTFTAEEEWLLTGTISGPRAEGGAAEVPRDLPVEEVEVEVQVAGIEDGAILSPAPYLTTRVSGGRAPDMRYDDSSGTLTVPGARPLVEGDRYVASAALPMASPAQLRQVPFPAGDEFTQLPAGVPSAVVDLGQQIIAEAGATTMFDQALAVQERLRGWSYSVTPRFGEGATNLERFINGQEGYCEQFAGTMAVILRTMGIPSRLVVGYTPGEITQDGVWEVTSAHAHAWVEVRFDDYGWIAFEPTPRSDGNVLVPDQSGVLPDQLQADRSSASAEPTPADPSASPTPSASPGAEGDPSPAAAESIPPSDGASPGATDPQATAGAQADQGSGAQASSRTGLVAGAALLLVALAAVAGLGVGRLGPTGGEDERIRRARAALQRTGAAAGHPRDPSETNHEYLIRLTGVLGIQPPDRATALAQAVADPASRADFALGPADGDAAQVEDAVAQLRAVMRSTATRRAALRMRWADLRHR